MNIPASLEIEFEAHAKDAVFDGRLTTDNLDEVHHILFNEDYYIVGYHKASQWLKEHDIDPFEAVSECIEYERDTFGEVTKHYENAETVANMLAYVLGEQWLVDSGNDYIEELLEEETCSN